MANDEKINIYKFKDPTKIAKISMFLLFLYSGISILLSILNIFQYNLAVNIKKESIFLDEAISSNDAHQVDLFVIMLLLYVVTSIFFCFWYYRAISNARSFQPTEVTFKPGWSIAWYFTPIIWLYGPYQDMKKLWKVSKNPNSWKEERLIFSIKIWWTLWLTSNIFFYCSPVMDVLKWEEEWKGDYFLMVTGMEIIGYAMSAICAYCLILIIKQISKNQTQVQADFSHSASLNASKCLVVSLSTIKVGEFN